MVVAIKTLAVTPFPQMNSGMNAPQDSHARVNHR
jgi:hypothetical protein